MIPVYEPSLGREELENIVEAVKTGWISSRGKFIPEFEQKFAEYCGSTYGVACSNGTTALHLALTALGIQKGDEVIVPTLTFVSTANAVVFTGAKPVFVDSNPNYWCIDPERITSAITKNTKAIIPVHLYGHPSEMKAIMRIAKENQLYVIEDAAEAHGARCYNQKIGGIGDVGCFSFYGNKMITTGEGGMCMTKNEEIAEKMKILRDHGMTPKRKYWHDRIGFNYRMTNLQAALGVAQIKKLDDIICKKRMIAEGYQKKFEELETKKLITCHPEMPWAKNTYWMYSILIEKNFPISRDTLVKRLEEENIETRPFFYPLHVFPMYNTGKKFPISEELSKKGINLPSSANLEEREIHHITEKIYTIINS